MNGLLIQEVSKTYGELHALDGISFKVGEGEIVAVLGPSGCGKSTLLSIISGLEPADKGEISWQGVSLSNVPTHKRGFGLMFQDLMLFPHRNVQANIAFGLEMMKWDETDINKQVETMLSFVGLSGYEVRSIHTLSGGEQQRVALARSLAPRPRLLMLDEPFSSLDRSLRERLIQDLKQVLKALNQTALYITHDQEEAFSLADRVVVMNKGQVVQIGTPESIYTQPKNEFVARFLGFKNIFNGILRGKNIVTSIGNFKTPTLTQTLGKKDGVEKKLLLRPDKVKIKGEGDHQLQGIVIERAFRGGLSTLVLDVKGKRLTFEFQSGLPLPPPGKTVKLDFIPDEAIQFLS